MDHVWSYDFIFDQTDDGGRLKWLPVLDEPAALIAAENGADIIRVHDVSETKDALRVWEQIQNFRE